MSKKHRNNIDPQCSGENENEREHPSCPGGGAC